MLASIRAVDGFIQSARVTFIRGGRAAPHAYVRAQTLQTVFEARAAPKGSQQA